MRDTILQRPTRQKPPTWPLTPTSVKTSAYNAIPGDFVPVDATGGTVTVTLPTAPADNARIGVKIVAQAATPNTVTVAAGGSDVFNIAAGSASLSLAAKFQSVLLQYNAASGIWYAQSTDSPLGTASGAAKLGTDNTVGGPGGSALTPAAVNDSAGVNAPLRDVAGSQLVNVPPFQANTLYPPGYVIQQGGLLYARIALGTSGATFAADAANWTALTAAGIELAYAEITGNPANFTTTEADIAGLSITFTAPARPVELSFWCYAIGQNTGAGNPQVKLTDNSNTAVGAAITNGVAAGGFTPAPFFISSRLSGLTPGNSYTYKARGVVSANTATLYVFAYAHAYIRAVQC